MLDSVARHLPSEWPAEQFLVRVRFVDGMVVAVQTLHEYGH